MNWEQKALALQALVGWPNFSIKMRQPQDWYVSTAGLDRREGSVLSGGFQKGKTPEDAIEQYWNWATSPEFHLQFRNYQGVRLVKWNGFMWEDVAEEK